MEKEYKVFCDFRKKKNQKIIFFLEKKQEYYVEKENMSKSRYLKHLGILKIVRMEIGKFFIENSDILKFKIILENFLRHRLELVENTHFLIIPITATIEKENGEIAEKLIRQELKVKFNNKIIQLHLNECVFILKIMKLIIFK